MTMHPETRPPVDGRTLGAALAIAPAAMGCAAGLLLADHLKRKRRRGLASACLAVGVLAALPLAADAIAKALDSPARARGSNRKLKGIRDSGLNPDADIIGGEEFFVERLT